MQAYSTVQDLGVYGRESKHEGYFPDELFFSEPSAGRAEEGASDLESIVLREMVEETGGSGKQAGPQTWT
jgi:hypothetical protein